MLRRPEFSQPLITALQLAILAVMRSMKISPHSVVGHSSGEIAAAYAAGYVTEEDAIKLAFYRGEAASKAQDGSVPKMGMMAVALDFPTLSTHLTGTTGSVHLACFNSPSNFTLAGTSSALEEVQRCLSQDGHFSRMLKVDVPYHSPLVAATTHEYEELLVNAASLASGAGGGSVDMFSTVTGKKLDSKCDAAYWKNNMASPVLFTDAMQDMLTYNGRPNILIEVGPSDTLKGPILQIRKSLSKDNGPLKDASVVYHSALKMGEDSGGSLLHLAGSLYLSGYPISMEAVNLSTRNCIESTPPSVIVDLPNYGWNHTSAYWTESEASKDWRFRKFIHHDLLGTKVLGCSWHSPSWTKTLRLEDSPWLRDHRLGGEIVFPAAGYISMAIEAVYQTEQTLHFSKEGLRVNQLQYQLREVEFIRALVLHEHDSARLMLPLEPPEKSDVWHRFRVLSLHQSLWQLHCEGLVRLKKMSVSEGTSKNILFVLDHS